MDGISPRRPAMGGRGDAVTFAGIVRDWRAQPASHSRCRMMRSAGFRRKRGLTTYCQSESLNLLGRTGINWVRRFLKGIAARTRAIRSYEASHVQRPITLFPFNPSRPENAKA